MTALRRRFVWNSVHQLHSGARVILRNGTRLDIPTLWRNMEASAQDQLLTTEEMTASAFNDGDFHVLIAQEVDHQNLPYQETYTNERPILSSAVFQDSYRTW